VRAGSALALGVLVVLWGSAFPAIKVGLEGLSPLHLTLARHLVASAVFVAFLSASRSKVLPRRADVPALLGLGLIGITVYHVSLNLGQLQVSAGATSLIIATAPALTALIAYVVLHDALGPFGWLGTVLGLAGTALIVLGDGGQRLAPSLGPYAGLVLLAALATAWFAVLQRPLLQRYRPLELAAYVTWAGTLPMLLFLPGFGAALAGAEPRALLAALHLGVFPSAVAYTLFAFALSRAPATVVTAWLYLIPGFALLFSWWWLGEVPSALTLAGGAVVVAGVVLVNLSKRRERGPVRPAAAG
jgi:drug/metabolite transporter (DMT)-like permease